MTAIVCNTATGAVTEYDWTFQSLTDTHAASPDGLFTLGGDTDAGAAITGQILSGKPGGKQVQGVRQVFVANEVASDGVLIVQGRSTSWEYPVASRDSGVGVASPGRGIRESYLGFGYRNTAGADFCIDRIDADVVAHTTRRK